MKKLLKRIRFWIIKKLGGCTTEIKRCYTCDNAVTLKEQIAVDELMLNHARGVGEEAELLQSIKRELFNQLAVDISNDKSLYTAIERHDFETSSTVYRVDIRIVRS